MTAAGLREPPAAKALLILAAVAYIAFMLLLPLGAVLYEALRKGWEMWLAAVSEPDARASIRLTLIVAAIAVPLNTIFGIAAAWAIAKFDFRGKTALIALIELPFSVSPVVSGRPDAVFPHLAFDWFPLQNPGIVSIPLGFLAGWLGTVLSRERADRARHAELEVRSLTGASTV